MVEPLIRRSEAEEARRIKTYSTIKTTPESIVRIYRDQKARREPPVNKIDMPYIFTPKRPRIPWHAKIDWNFVINGTCIGILIFVGAYLTIRMGIPFLRTLWIN